MAINSLLVSSQIDLIPPQSGRPKSQRNVVEWIVNTHELSLDVIDDDVTALCVCDDVWCTWRHCFGANCLKTLFFSMKIQMSVVGVKWSHVCILIGQKMWERHLWHLWGEVLIRENMVLLYALHLSICCRLVVVFNP